MKSKISDFIKKYWLLIIIITQPILDIIAYFSFDEKLTPISFAIRSIYLLFIILYSFFTIKEKKKMFLYLLPIGLFCIFHLLNSYRLSGFDLFDDIRYLILVMQMPIIAISLYFYVKENKFQVEKIEKGMVISFIIIFISVFLSFVTGTYVNTYEGYGITGWFTSCNTQSMILSIISPFILYYFSNKNDKNYILAIIMVFLLLYFNGTRACYYTLLSLLIVILYTLLVNKKCKNKVIVTSVILLLSILFYNSSFTSTREENVEIKTEENEKILKILNENSVNDLDKEVVIEILNTNYLYRNMIDAFGEDKVYNQMKNKLTAYNLSNNRLVKKTYAKIIFEDSDFVTKLVGFNHKEIEKYSMDLENDISAIFYYYGYLGFTIYMGFILIFVFFGIKLFVKNPCVLFSNKFILLSYDIALAVLGGQYSGALLRKTNANIYVALILILYILFLEDKFKKTEKNNKKISFLLLHLGYGGIESSTINTANSLIDDYEIELMSFYKLNKNQSAKIDERIKVKYLYDGEPNREEFKNSIKNHKYLKTLKEGIKAVDILLRKKLLVIDYIFNCDSKYIVSTRWDFSILLSKFGNKETIKIAQEHHYHNNDNKYINVIKKKYNNIDYLFALTKTLEDDYNKFLVNNNHTKVVLVPNMLENIPDVNSKLKDKNIITVSRLDYGKKNDDIIKAFSKLDDMEWKLYIIGDGSEYNSLSSLIDELKLNDRVILTGYKDKKEIEKYMLKSSLFLMASLTEGLPMVLLEAMSYGIPCIAYETASGVSDIINNNKNGYVIKDRNEKEYIEKIEKVIGDTELRKKLGKEAKKTVYNFSNESILKIWKNILK